MLHFYQQEMQFLSQSLFIGIGNIAARWLILNNHTLDSDPKYSVYVIFRKKEWPSSKNMTHSILILNNQLT